MRRPERRAARRARACTVALERRSVPARSTATAPSERRQTERLMEDFKVPGMRSRRQRALGRRSCSSRAQKIGHQRTGTMEVLSRPMNPQSQEWPSHRAWRVILRRHAHTCFAGVIDISTENPWRASLSHCSLMAGWQEGSMCCNWQPPHCPKRGQRGRHRWEEGVQMAVAFPLAKRARTSVTSTSASSPGITSGTKRTIPSCRIMPKPPKASASTVPESF